MIDPTTREVARDLRQLEARVERERVELFKELNRRFDALDEAIARQADQRITREVYAADQRRFESELKMVRAELAQTRRLVVTSFLSVLAVAALAVALGF